MKRPLMSIAKAAACGLFLATFAQAATTVTTTADQTITGAKTFSGSCKVLLAGSTSGTTCLNAPAIAGSTTAIVFPAAAGTLATLAGTETFTNKSIAFGQLTGLGSGVATWLGTPTGANLLATVSGCSGTSTFLRADGTCAVAGSSSASDLTSGTLDCAREPAYTGDVTTSAGSCANTLANIPTATPAAGSLLVTNIAAPSTPASGKTSVYVDSTAKTLKAKNDAGTVSTTVIADTGSANNFLTAVSAAGVISKAQPGFTDISGSVAASQMPALTGDVTTSAGAVATTIASSAVTTVKINANAVTNAKQAQMAAHTFKGNNTGSTADPADLTATQATAELNAFVGDSGSGGTKGLVPAPASGDAAAGKVLKADGSWATVSGVAGGSLVLLEQHTASTSSSMAFTSFYSSSYDTYQFDFIDVAPASNNVNFVLEYSSDGGSTWNGTSNYYSFVSYATNAGGGGAATNGNPSTTFILGTGFSNAASRVMTGWLRLHSLSSTVFDKNAEGLYACSNQSNAVTVMFGGLFTVPGTAFNAVRFRWSSGNFRDGGAIRAFGIAKS